MVSSVSSMIDQFNMPNIKILIKQGYEVHVATNFHKGNTSSKLRINKFIKELKELGVICHNIEFSRKISDVFKNIEAYKKIKYLMRINNYEFVHCHSPIGGVCGRLAAHRTNTKVIYTAHGFHFFKGAPLKNWLLFYPVERMLANFTDVLITINSEDYKRAQKFRASKIKYIPGVGVDVDNYAKTVIDKSIKRKELGIPSDAFLILSVGELNNNKNHEVIIRALAKINKSNVFYIICGQGKKRDYLMNLASSLGIEHKVKLLGFRTDVREIYQTADLFAFPSKREGLGLSALEAMASSLPLITSNIHGIVDYSVYGETGFTYSPTDVDGFAEGINKMIIDIKERKKIGEHNFEIVKKFDIKKVNIIMDGIYKNI